MLGAASLSVLDLPDGGLAPCDAEMRQAIAAAVAAHGAAAVATLWRHDPHPDHQAVSRAAVAAAATAGVAVAEFALWTTHWTEPAEVGDEVVLVDSGEQASLRKQEALACYVSQNEPLRDDLDPIVPAAVRGWPHEYVVRPSTPPLPPPALARLRRDVHRRRRPLGRRVVVVRAPQARGAAGHPAPRALRPRLGARLRPGPGLGPARGPRRRARRQRLVDGRDRAGPSSPRRCRPTSASCAPQLPEVPLDGTVDLLLVAEFLYYVPDLPGALDALWSVTAPGTQVVFLHWAHRPHDAHRSGPEMHARIYLDSQRRDAVKLVSHSDQDFLLDVYEVTG